MARKLLLAGIAAFATLSLAPQALAQTACVPIQDRTVPTRGGFPGLAAKPNVRVETDAAGFAHRAGFRKRGAAKEAAALEAAGFVAGVSRLYNPKRGKAAQALSSTFQLGSPEQALATQTRILKRVEDRGTRRFPLPAIPGAVAIRSVGGGTGSAANVYFTEGAFFYIVGEYRRRGSTRKDVARVATALYNRVRGAAVC